MSFSKIPEFAPYADITLEDAVNLLLSSIALEEMSLSRLMDAETNKIQFVINESKGSDSALQDALKVNKSVDVTIKNIIKLQMLLQFKLENVREFLPVPSTKLKVSAYVTTATEPTVSASDSCSTTKTPRGCSFIGKGKGFVTNSSDEFYCQTAELQVFLRSSDSNKRLLYYFVQNDANHIQLKASSSDISISYIGTDKLKVQGKGHVEKSFNSDKIISETADFTLYVIYHNSETIEYRLIIKCDPAREINHDSGCIQIKNQNIALSFDANTQ